MRIFMNTITSVVEPSDVIENVKVKNIGSITLEVGSYHMFEDHHSTSWMALSGCLLVPCFMLPARKMNLLRVYLNITADGAPLGKIIMDLCADVVPKTAENL